MPGLNPLLANEKFVRCHLLVRGGNAHRSLMAGTSPQTPAARLGRSRKEAVVL
uniref:Uncharacterized protein n=1 Tax=Anguilla anguilla TaxID=7936 RepID=A0A0E9TXU9_ANGAN